ncbi:hypothetical protein H634G_04082 [Metarhizium anisopliae BRIP 53293]|uniref:DUF3328 domain-containing protein n=1 Tax=Metarhizium anisopliae BRIP 53293 TaxID=1291518 RepID=A0A0D9P172_METAN|nr:hypothetical protein H634G_04082 [Metarhizium anisopliae BRIP 53293]KJK95847.1 hypothetical protein H633G_00196 [Metarhizium anisopliae BRIP 53284]
MKSTADEIFASRNHHSYEKASSSDEDHLLCENGSFLDQKTHRSRHDAPSKYGLIRTAVLICSVVLNVCLLGFLISMYSLRGPSNPIFPESLYSPLQEAIRYKTVLFTSGFGSQKTKYMGNSTAADDAWKALYPRTVVRIPKSSADQLVNQTIPLNGDEDHFPVLISVFHEMHCLDSIRHIYFGHTKGFDQNPVINEAILAPEHIDHCFDSLRQTLMCGGDVAPMPYKWVEERKKALGHLDVQHTCRDYEALLEWAARPEHDITGWDEKIKPTSIP